MHPTIPDSSIPPWHTTSGWPAPRHGSRKNRVERTHQWHTTIPGPRALERRLRELDEIRSAFWMAYRHLFPSHATALQTPSGEILITWSMLDDPHANNSHAAPVMLRIEQSLVDLMRCYGFEQRLRIAAHHEESLRSGMVGYDPYAAWSRARIVVLG